MGFVVLLSARVLAQVSDLPIPAAVMAAIVPHDVSGSSESAADLATRRHEVEESMRLLVVIVTVGCVATVYTMLGGLRAVIWTDVVQIILLIGGGLLTIGFIAVTTDSWLPDWYAAAARQLTASHNQHTLPLFTLDPFVRATVVTVALNMCIWHVCTHVGNQMTVQRYFSTNDARAARRSFVTGSLVGVGLNLMLVVVGLAVLYYYFGQGRPIDRGFDPARDKPSLIFPTFAVERLPAGCGGAILAALLAAAMSSIDSGINSIATVITTEQAPSAVGGSHVKRAKWITLAAGMLITIAAFGLNFLPSKWGVVDAMPRTFNAITAPLGGLFLVGMFLPRVGQRAAIAGSLCELVTSIGLGYFEQLAPLLRGLGWATSEQSISFTWIMPCSLAVTMTTAWLFSLAQASCQPATTGLTWQTRNAKPNAELALDELSK